LWTVLGPEFFVKLLNAQVLKVKKRIFGGPAEKMVDKMTSYLSKVQKEEV
jgi:hypothetical protein